MIRLYHLQAKNIYNDWSTKSKSKPDDNISQSKRKILWLGPMPNMLNPWEQQQQQQEENELQQSSFKRRKELLHPLRTNQWEFNIHWFHHHRHHPQNDNKSSSKMMMLREMKTTTVIIELDYPTGYCRVFPRNKNNNEFPIGIGRWTKRPWGITIRIHPLEVIDSSSIISEQHDNNNQKRRRFSSSDTSNKNQNNPVLLKLDPQREYILCSSAFHWNGFGEQPKLTQGTILQQKPNLQQQSKSNRMLSSSWWIWYENEDDDDYERYYDKMITRVHNEPGRLSLTSSSSNTPTLKGKLLDYYQQSNRLVVARNVIGWVCSRRVTIPNFHGQWFRPVVGSFSGKGIGDDTSKCSLT